jgi:UDP-N-acetylmuramyl pentapeptide phosphotransferase/UDP-N-acetylglucosamine-1-phosphate transferase
MGDSGSLTLGFILGFLCVKYSMDNPVVMYWRSDCMILAFTFVVVPVFDVARVSLVRIVHRMPVFKADKNHIHHKLMRAGLGQHGTLIVILILALVYIILNLQLSVLLSITWVVVVDVLVWLLFHQAVNMMVRKNGQQPFLMVKQDE